MKITEEILKQIIKEELEQQEFGKSTVSRAQRAKDLKTKAIDSQSQVGIDNIERGIIKQFTDRLQKLAEVSNLKSGRVSSLLKRLYGIMDEEIQKLGNREQKDEK